MWGLCWQGWGPSCPTTGEVSPTSHRDVTSEPPTKMLPLPAWAEELRPDHSIPISSFAGCFPEPGPALDSLGHTNTTRV